MSNYDVYRCRGAENKEIMNNNDTLMNHKVNVNQLNKDLIVS